LNANTYGPSPDQSAVVDALEATNQPAQFVSLNGGSAGQPIYLRIQGANVVDFTVGNLYTTGKGSNWPIRLRARAIGCQETEYHRISINP